MELQIISEAELFLHAVLLGLLLATVNEVLALLRRVWHHKTVAVAILDVMFWTLTGVLLIAMVYQENDGQFRGYIFFGIGVGVGIKCICKRILVKFVEKREDAPATKKNH